ncbi:MAG: acyltransferase [Inconstantimicrobium porci]|uniref:acyltransferase n=1 Tax=Inconstantimicrobium porci TaxID=2652291 RepID=UPI002A915680|nr:acyltransferase [Inconstantimicrobium porci]MDY5911142.1 acyltransferase [Inconstantimicrobium porci]
MKKRRLYYMDLIKFIAMIFVCCYHFSWAGISYADKINATVSIKMAIFSINSMCVPLFFLVNGGLILNKELYSQTFVKKVIRLFLVYFIWRAITILVIASYKGIPINSYGEVELLKGILFDELRGVDLSHFWFIKTLIKIYLVVPFVKAEYDYLSNEQKRDNFIKYFLGALLTVSFFIPDINNMIKVVPKLRNAAIYDFSHYNIVPGIVGTMLCYFIIGGLLVKYSERIKLISIWKVVLTFFAGMLMLFAEWYIVSKVAGSEFDIVFKGYSTIGCMLMSMSFFVMMQRIPNSFIEKNQRLKSFITIMGTNTFTVYYLHWIFGYTLLSHFTINTSGIVVNFIKAVVITVIFSYVGALLRKIPIIKKLIL